MKKGDSPKEIAMNDPHSLILLDGIQLGARAWDVVCANRTLCDPTATPGPTWIPHGARAGWWKSTRFRSTMVVRDSEFRYRVLYRTRAAPLRSTLDDIVDTIEWPDFNRYQFSVYPSGLRIPVTDSWGNLQVPEARSLCAKVFPTDGAVVTKVRGVDVEFRVTASVERDTRRLFAEAILGHEHVRRNGTDRALIYPPDARHLPVLVDAVARQEFFTELLLRFAPWVTSLRSEGVWPDRTVKQERRLGRAYWTQYPDTLWWHLRIPGDLAPCECAVRMAMGLGGSGDARARGAKPAGRTRIPTQLELQGLGTSRGGSCGHATKPQTTS